MSAEPENAPNSGEEARDPSGFLSEIIGAPVTVKLNSGVVYKVGELQSVDGYMNIALEDTKEMVDGKQRRNYGDAFVRGNNGRCKFLCCCDSWSLRVQC
ncbi:uncharacterized protein MYCGRDRAFT_74163 [Zymoseptoria tritici IPO323]|uniref:U6 snRNA-associated Sm-like protein LSm6 n=1 Tax=Zymoseptoria tritici (strain CBS 115943 / IPO323) TaxID=336722 RepID=F9XG58_ZYMTI|nr:uncharacterized protein MYCGRDRAFT_74163 [Zymoseptoria tritici IPO323]EGP86057.1 hypothetical protein MYCGRDRAFT_74163 [Zymoseptoria tritici IPO323]